MYIGGGDLGKAAIAAIVASLLTFGGLAYSPVLAAGSDDTDTLTNQMVSRTRGNTQVGDFTSYDDLNRNLVINWTNDDRGDGAAIRDADVTAKNITINTNFERTDQGPNGDLAHQFTSKGVISDVSTHIKASGDIKITSYDDSVYTEGTGTTTIEGFKNLIIKSTKNGYGLVDNGGGITVKGKTDSVVNITTEADQYHAAIGNSLLSYLADDSPDYKLGTGITIDAGQITLDSKYRSIFAGVGLNDTFAVNLNAPSVTLKGEVTALR